MKTNEIDIGGIYVAKVTGKLAKVRIERENAHGGWDATNLETNRRVRIKSARRLRHEVDERCDEAGANPGDHGRDDESGRDGDQHDAEGRCSTRHCRGKAVLEYLDKPLCQQCWQRQADKSEASDVTQPTAPITRPQGTATQGDKHTNDKENPTNNGGLQRLSALDAAAAVLADASTPMRCGELITTMAAKNLWASPNGKTPQATLNSALIREISRKGDQSRFRRCGRGMFKLNKVPAPPGATSI